MEEKKETKNEGFSQKCKKLSAGMSISLCIGFMLCFFAPMEMFIANKSNLWFDIYDVLLGAVLFLVLSFCINVVLFAVLDRINRRLYGCLVIVEFICFLMAYIYGNFLSGSLPGLAGGSFEYSEFKKEIIIAIILWIALSLTMLILVRRFSIEKVLTVIGYIGLFMTAVFALTLIIEIFTRGGKGILSVNTDAVATTDHLMELSSDKNVVILLLDSYDSTVGSELLKEGSEYAEALGDFTYYKNASGGYPHTKESIPLIISGKWFENREDFSGFSTRCFKDSAFLKHLEENGYGLDWYGSITCNDDSVYRFRNFKKLSIGIKSYKNFYTLFAKLVCLKYGPYFIKTKCIVEGDEFNHERKINNADEYELFKNKLLDFNEVMEENDISLVKERAYKFIHLEGAHKAYDITPELEHLDDKSGTYEDKCKAALKIAIRYIEELKEAGIYDNTAVVIMGDHGNEDIQYGMDPLLLVKGFGEKHELQISEAPVSYEEINEAFIRLSDGEASDEIFDWKEADERTRRFLFYYEFYDDDHLIEYEINGDVLDPSSVRETGRVFAR